jgi:GDP-mannose 6-dehydrogenase
MEAITNTDITFVTVGTPTNSDGFLNLENIYTTAKCCGEAIKIKKDFHLVVIRSTIVPGTFDKFVEIIETVSGKTNKEHFAVLINPEFLREGYAVYDFFSPPFILIGSEPNNDKAVQLLSKLYEEVPAKVIVTSIKNAEFIKLVNNTFHALKISFANEIGNICKEIDIDSHEVMDLFIQDKVLNISAKYLKPGFAFGGSCLPKDLKCLETIALSKNLNVPLIQSISKTNDFQIQRAMDILNNFNGSSFGFLGLSFKEGTEDLRNSPSLILAEKLFKSGKELMIYDKHLEQNRFEKGNKNMLQPFIKELMVSKLDDLMKKSDVIVLINKETEYIDAIKRTEHKTIVDFVGIDYSIRKNHEYYGINW